MHKRLRIKPALLALLFLSLSTSCAPRRDNGGQNAAPLAAVVVSGRSIIAPSAVVVTSDSIASRVGVDVLRRGGNAIDAAVAVSFALAVTYPRAGNMGGGGFMLVRLSSGDTHFIDYRETAPAEATRDMFLDSAGDVIEGRSTRGHLAAGVPGTVAGMALAHERFGTLPWSELVSYAWTLAKDGFPVDSFFVNSIADERSLLESHEETKRIFVDPALAPGDVFRQPDLAETLHRLMADRGKDFYEGRTADLIVSEMERRGGLISKDDLAAYRAKIREPIRAGYHGYEIVSAPLPSSGGIILSALFQILGRHDVGQMEYHAENQVHLFTEAEKIVYRLRALYMGDADFYPAPWEALTAPSYTERLDRLIDLSRVLSVRELDAIDLSPPSEANETTHFSIVDTWGNAVSNTYTLNGWFGCGVTVAGTGILLNNEMDDFSIKPGYPNLYGLVGSEANAIEPGKRMLSSMAPTIVQKDGELFMVVGSPGGSTIPTTILQVISNVVDFGMSLEDAVAARRVHNQYLPDQISVEANALSAVVVEALRAAGYTVAEREAIGDVQAILIDRDENGRGGDPKGPRHGRLRGVSDPRGNGRAIGY